MSCATELGYIIMHYEMRDVLDIDIALETRTARCVSMKGMRLKRMRDTW